MTRHFLLGWLLLTGLTTAARADVTLVGSAAIPGDTADLSGLAGKLSDGTPRNRLGGLSGIAYAGKGNEYVLLADRGPKDGATDYPCRLHRFTVTVDPKAAAPVSLKLLGTTPLTDERDRPLVGAIDALDPRGSQRFDPEGVRVGRGGEIFVSDEYGPVVYRFGPTGRWISSLPVPARFLVANPSASPDEERKANPKGRVPNRGMEGLAISPDGSKLYGIMQSPLIQDGGTGKDKDGKWAARNARILEVDACTGRTREFVYRLDNAGNGLNEILAVNDHEFLVIERDSKPGKDAAFKKLMLIDIADATDVSGVDSLPAGDLPATITPVKKKPFLDILDKKFGIAGENCPEKFEGIAFGPDLPDGRRLLLLTADNDFIPEQPFRLYAFAVDRADLPGFTSQQFDPKR